MPASATEPFSRPAFVRARGFRLDPFQERALDAIDADRSVLVAAPTGSGKTLVAEYAIERTLARGGRIFYTTPIKALSNQKYHDLAEAHGHGRVGLLTGDHSIRGRAPIVVMTTEVLRNMIYSGAPGLDDVHAVVLDEVHYLQDPHRGAVWEEVIIHLSADVRLVCLSATVSNAEEVADWIATVRGATDAVIEERRPVELRHLYAAGDRAGDGLVLVPTFVPGPEGPPVPNPEAARLDQRAPRPPGRRGRSRLHVPWRTDVVERLAAESMLPAIVFIFSRAGCDQAVDQCLAAGIRLTSAADRRRIRAIADAHTAALAPSDLDVLDHGVWRQALESGLAAHHAGMVPPMKEAVEEAFSAGLVKVVFATETLALGINMPARSVVIEKLSKFTGERHEMLTPGQYTQLAGRAGRRGLDDVGHVVVCWNPYVTFDQVARLASRRVDALRSSFRPNYNMAANLVRRYRSEEAHHLLNLSFAQYHADRDVVGLEHRAERIRRELREAQDRARVDDDLLEYQRRLGELDAARRTQRRGSRLGALAPGDVVSRARRGQRAVILEAGGNRSRRVLALTEDRELVRLGDRDVASGPVAHLELPVPFQPRNPEFRREAAARLRRVALGEPAADAGEERIRELERALGEHPLARDGGVDARLRAWSRAQRHERDLARLERRLTRRSDSLARQFDRVLEILESWGYVSGWELTAAGAVLARINTEGDLVLAESLREGLLDDLDPAETASVVSCFTFERRGPEDEPRPPARWPSARVARRSRAIERIAQDLGDAERDARLSLTRPVDPGLTTAIHDWAAGTELAEILDAEEMTGGDFVRNVKQCIDLLRQVGEVAPDPATAASARSAADACLRGVVAVSGLAGPED